MNTVYTVLIGMHRGRQWKTRFCVCLCLCNDDDESEQNERDRKREGEGRVTKSEKRLD